MVDFVDGAGFQRKLGLWLPKAGRVMAMASFETTMPNNVLDDSAIKRLISDPNRSRRRQFFDDYWMRKGDQGQHGSCNGWAGAMGLSKTRWLRGIRDKLVLSGSYVYSWINGNQDNGSDLYDGMNELMEHGAPPMEQCGPNLIYRSQTSKFDAEARKHLGAECWKAETKQGFRSGIALGFIGIVAVQVAGAFQNFKGPGIIPAYRGPGNHAMHVDDMYYYKGTEVFDTCNNWNVTWGDKGRCLSTWDSFEEPFDIFDFYLIGSSEEAGE